MACHTFMSLLCYLRLLFDCLVDYFFSLYWDGKKKKIPDLEKKHALLAESATTLARKIRQKEVTSEQLVLMVIERMKQVNPLINAVIGPRYEQALEEARKADELIASGLSEKDALEKPFLGVPFTTKESQAIKGVPLTLGLWSRRNEVASEDSEAVVRLRKAGAIPLAATNLPELLIWQETRNVVFGQTNNPHHTGRSPGGSSGAEAALTATYATPISLCSDIGGSTRIPAFYCGMFGHHPTAGSTNLRGVFLRKGDEYEDTMFTLGFISKQVEDLAPLTKIIAGEKADLLKLDRNIDIKNINFYYMETANDCSVSPMRSDMKGAMQSVITKITKEVPTENCPKPYSHEGFNSMYKLWDYWMAKEPDNYSKLYTNGNGQPNAIMELIKKSFCLSKRSFFTIVQLLAHTYMPKARPEWAEKMTKDMKEDIVNKLGDNGVLLFPSAPSPSPYHYACFMRPYNFSYFAIINALRLPSTQVPLGVNSQGLPLGIQVVSAPYNDALCLAVAKYLEKEFGGAVMACNVQK